MKNRIEYLYEPDFEILHKIDDLDYYIYNPETNEWDEDEDEDVYFYRKNVDVLDENEAKKLMKELMDDTRKS